MFLLRRFLEWYHGFNMRLQIAIISGCFMIFAALIGVWGKGCQSEQAKQSIDVKNSPGSNNTQATGDVVNGDKVLGDKIVNQAYNSKKPARKLDQQLKDELLQGLKGQEGRAIEILYTIDDIETFNFAKQFKEFLVDSGWKIEKFNSAVFFSKEPRTGINVDIKKEGNIVIKIYKL